MFRIKPKPDPSDRDSRWAMWIRRIAKGDIEALAALYDESSPLLFGLVLQILPERGPAEEVLVQIYNKVREEARRFAAREQNPADWLITLTRNLATERLRPAMPEHSNVPRDLFNDERNRANLMLAQLSEQERSMLEMTYLGGVTIDEVANRLEVSREYVSKQILFGMRKLKMMRARFKSNPAENSEIGFDTFTLADSP